MDVTAVARALDHRQRTPTMRQAKVTAVNAGPPHSVDIMLGGNPVPRVRYLASYSPTVADSVWLVQFGPDILILGKLA